MSYLHLQGYIYGIKSQISLYKRGFADESLVSAIGLSFPFTAETRYNEPLYNEFLSITNDILRPSNSKIYRKEPRYNETSL